MSSTEIAPAPTERASSGAAPDPGVRSRWDVLRPSRFSGVYLTLLFIVVFGLWVPDTFLTTTTLKSILSEESITAVAALGLLAALSVQTFDVSVGAMLGLGAVLAAWLTTKHGLGLVPTVAIVVAVGAIVGAINGGLIVFAKVDSFITTLGMSSILIAVVLRITDGQYISGVPDSFGQIASPQPLGIPILAFYVVVMAVLAWYVLEHTPIGRRMYATGADPEAARLAGVRTGRLVFWSMVTTSVIAGLAGVLLTAKLGSAAPDQGFSYLLPIFAAALLGTTQIHPGRPSVMGTIVAVILLAVGIKGLQLTGADQWVTELFYGVALVVAVAAASLSKQGLVRSWTRRARTRGPATPADPA